MTQTMLSLSTDIRGNFWELLAAVYFNIQQGGFSGTSYYWVLLDTVKDTVTWAWPCDCRGKVLSMHIIPHLCTSAYHISSTLYLTAMRRFSISIEKLSCLTSAFLLSTESWYIPVWSVNLEPSRKAKMLVKSIH